MCQKIFNCYQAQVLSFTKEHVWIPKPLPTWRDSQFDTKY